MGQTSPIVLVIGGVDNLELILLEYGVINPIVHFIPYITDEQLWFDLRKIVKERRLSPDLVVIGSEDGPVVMVSNDFLRNMKPSMN